MSDNTATGFKTFNHILISVWSVTSSQSACEYLCGIVLHVTIELYCQKFTHLKYKKKTILKNKSIFLVTVSTYVLNKISKKWDAC